MEGIYNQENLFIEFKMQKTNADKVKFLKEMKQLKQTQPSLFRGTRISVKQFDNLILEWSKPHPWREINAEIKRKNKQIKSTCTNHQQTLLITLKTRPS